tara:strand:+ start:1298 stop:1453 length:156 start_codon:yes stop_codon:yes gene_type:complete
MELKLTKKELKYLTLIVEDNLEYNKAFMDMDSETFMDMLHNLYSKLVILNK